MQKLPDLLVLALLFVPASCRRFFRAITVIQSPPLIFEGLFMHCALYDAGRCRSCQWLERPVSQQLADKMADLRTLLADAPGR
jgi:hypothetical protein